MIHPGVLWPRTLYKKALLFLLLFLWFSLFSGWLIFSSLTTSASPLSSSPLPELSNNTVFPAIILRAVFCLNASYETKKKKQKKEKRMEEGEIKMSEACIVKMFLHVFFLSGRSI